MGPEQCGVSLSRLGKAVGVLTAILGVAGLAVLPLEHVHEGADQANHTSVVHRHFGGHPQGVTTRLHATPLGRHCGDDEHEPTDTIRVVFTAAARTDTPGDARVAVPPGVELGVAPAPAGAERFVPPRLRYASPPGPRPALRGPPAVS
jgi:hypothetical protein